MRLAGEEAGSGGATHCPGDSAFNIHSLLTLFCLTALFAQHSLISPGPISPFPSGQT